MDKHKKGKKNDDPGKSRSNKKPPEDFEDINGPDDAEIGDDLTPEEIIKKKRESKSPDDEAP